jgi:hypothetical protein
MFADHFDRSYFYRALNYLSEGSVAWMGMGRQERAGDPIWKWDGRTELMIF